MPIIIQLSAFNDGFGDYVFCLKLAENIHKFINHEKTPPLLQQVYIVTTTTKSAMQLRKIYSATDYPDIKVISESQYGEMFINSNGYHLYIDTKTFILENKTSYPLNSFILTTPAKVGDPNELYLGNVPKVFLQSSQS